MGKKRRSLRYVGLRPPTVKAYKSALQKFFRWLVASRLPMPKSYSELDSRLAEALDEMWQEGEPLTYGGHLMSAIKRFLPSTRFRLLLAKQFYANWRSTHRVKRAAPLPVHVVEAMAMAARAAGQQGLSLAVLLGFFGLLRTAELISVKASDCRVIDQGRAVVVALPHTKTSKKEMESVVIRHRIVAGLVARAARARPGKRFYTGSAVRFRRDFLALQHALGFGKTFSAYSLRRGGATAWWLRSNSLDSVVIMGRWRDRQTARIYLDDARASIARSTLSITQRVRVREYRTEWLRLRRQFHK